MRLDKLTTQFQQALSDAQSQALANDHQYIDPLHLLAAVITQPDGSGKALLERSGSACLGSRRQSMRPSREFRRCRARAGICKWAVKPWPC